MVITTCFFVSLVALIFLFANKKREIQIGRPYLKLVLGSDFHLKRRIENARTSVRAMPKRAVHATAFYAVKHGMNVYVKTKALIRPKIAHIIEAVRGKDIPTNKGAVSLYLKKIEEHKKGLK